MSRGAASRSNVQRRVGQMYNRARVGQMYKDGWGRGTNAGWGWGTTPAKTPSFTCKRGPTSRTHASAPVASPASFLTAWASILARPLSQAALGVLERADSSAQLRIQSTEALRTEGGVKRRRAVTVRARAPTGLGLVHSFVTRSDEAGYARNGFPNPRPGVRQHRVRFRS